MAKQEKTAAELYREERKARIAKAAKKNAKKSHKVIMTKKTKAAIAVVVVIAIAAGIGAFAINNSGVLERGKIAFNVGDIEITAPEYGYYYSGAFSNYFNYSYQYDMYYGEGMGAAYTGYDYATAPDVQPYTAGEIEGVEEPMYTDFFDQQAKQSLRYVKASVKYAEENGITLDEDDLKEVEETINEMEASAKESNYSLAAYLRAFYGKGMSVSLLEQISREQAITTKVQEAKLQEYKDSYSDKKIEKTYNEALKTYGLVSLRLYEVTAETVTVEAETEGAEATQETTDKTMADAKTKAESFASKVSDAASFKATAAEFEKLADNEKYKEMQTDDTKTLLEDKSFEDLSYDVSDEDFLDWAFDEDTAEGETYIVENDDVGYSVYMMQAPVHKAADSKTYDVRHILFKFPEEEEDAEEAEETEDAAEETEEAEEEAEEEKDDVKVELLDTSAYDVTVDIDVDLEDTGDKALYAQAQNILKEYLDGEKTEDAFAALAVKYSADGNAADGGIYEDVTEGYMVAEFENWALADGREYGDVGIVETTYGYHVMFFIGTETTTWSDVIKDDLANEEYNEFAEELEQGENVAIDGIVEDSLADIEEFIVKLAKQQIRSIQSNASHTH